MYKHKEAIKGISIILNIIIEELLVSNIYSDTEFIIYSLINYVVMFIILYFMFKLEGKYKKKNMNNK